ncbi:Uncharacterized conserved protein [Citrobacter braakii]|nr:Uncharacterized conserved protein [Citrobacter braakii]
MKGVIRIGDKTTGGGQVLSGSSKMKFKGIGAARLNDPVSCPIEGHKPVIYFTRSPDNERQRDPGCLS